VAGATSAYNFAPVGVVRNLGSAGLRVTGIRRAPLLQRSARRSDRPKLAFRKLSLDADRRSDGRYLEISASSCPEDATLEWGWPPTYGFGPFALATPCTHVLGRCSGPSKFKSRVAHPLSWRPKNTHQKARPADRSDLERADAMVVLDDGNANRS
jgi:hypothetical protein